MTRFVLLLVSTLLLASPFTGAAQVGGAVPAPAAGADPVFTAAEPPPAAAAGLPQRAAAERTMRGYWHLFIAFAVTWLLLFGYALSLGRRFGTLERQMERQMERVGE
jgi:CcmD family protein